jgi:anti-anti-sigma factor
MVEFKFNTPESMLICTINGRMGTETNEAFLSQVTSKIDESRNALEDPAKLKVCFDMKEVTYIASSFIRSCIVVSRQVDVGHFNITNASPVIKKTFKIAGLDELLKVK